MASELAELVAAARNKTEAERDLTDVQRELATIFEQLDALGPKPATSRWRWKRDDGTRAARKRDHEARRVALEMEQARLTDLVAGLRERAEGADRARRQVGAAMSRLEAGLRDDRAVELEKLASSREDELTALTQDSEIIDRIRELQALSERTAYLLRTEGTDQSFGAMTRCCG